MKDIIESAMDVGDDGFVTENAYLEVITDGGEYDSMICTHTYD